LGCGEPIDCGRAAFASGRKELTCLTDTLPAYEADELDRLIAELK